MIPMDLKNKLCKEDRMAISPPPGQGCHVIKLH